jgi:NAD(P)-dependent dehydrogenase (short-subunit alcohol dehydrogenase family)
MQASNKIALVTGGSRGLGRNMATHLAAQGHDVILTYNTNEAEAKEVVSAIKATGRQAVALKLNVGDTASLSGFIESVKETLHATFSRTHFDFLINNAGMGGSIPFATATMEDVDRFYNVHYKGVFFLTQLALPILNDGGRIINISTGTTRFVNPGYHIYASMKSAIETLTRYLAKDLGSRQISVNVVAPGPVETDFNNAAIRSNPNIKAHLTAVTPLGRVGEPDDIGKVIAFLCSPDSHWINGQRIEVSGGINL